jgi:hypothetical protein
MPIITPIGRSRDKAKDFHSLKAFECMFRRVLYLRSNSGLSPHLLHLALPFSIQDNAGGSGFMFVNMHIPLRVRNRNAFFIKALF